MPVTPTLTVTGTLQDVFGAADLNGSIVIQLAGFGSLLPRIAGTSFIAKVAPIAVNCPLGTFSFTVWGNDTITPSGTYYIVSLLDDAGNVVQVQCYQLTGNGTVDLSTLSPYFPTPAPAPVSPSVVAGMVSLAYALSVTFNCALVAAGVILFKVPLNGNITSSSVTNMQNGQIVTIAVTQDATGNRTFAWPSSCVGTGVVDPTANYVSVQSFQYDGIFLRAITALLSYAG